VSAALVSLTLGTPISASADRSDVGTQYNGGFIAPGLFVGAEILASTNWDDRASWLTGVYFRTASVLSVFDIQVEYSVAGHTLKSGAKRGRMTRHSVSTSLNLHPFFTRMLAADYGSRVLSAFYLQLGLSGEFMSLEREAPDVDRTHSAFSLHWGAGFDMPLGDPNGDGAFWLGFNWRWKFVYWDPQFPGNNDTHAHQTVMVLTYRFNNISFTRIDRPDQMRWRE
jgi:hypothetical protein